MKERYRGCLLASAAGDALGGPLEFMRTKAQLSRVGGDRGVRDYLPVRQARGEVGKITDDTQMTMATAEGLVMTWSRDEESLLRSIYTAYLRWYDTQSIPELRRAPGHTCLSALGSGKMGTVDSPINDSKGSGGVMRVAPVGLAFPGDPDRAFAFGVRTAAMTHGHPGGYLSAGFQAALVSRLVAGEPLEPSARAELGRGELGSGLRRMLLTAADLASGPRTPWEAFDSMGWEGWTGDEALAIALFAVLRHPDSLEEALVTATFHVGDSDTTGAVAGAIMGSAHGEAAIPERWLEPLEYRSEIEELSDRLYELYAPGGGR